MIELVVYSFSADILLNGVLMYELHIIECIING